MSYYRNLAKKIFGPYLHYMRPETAEKWLYLNRIMYGMSSTYLGYLLYYKFVKEKEVKVDLSGKPMIIDHSEEHKRLREENVEYGVITRWSPEQGFETEEYHKDAYYQQLELEALKRSRIAQEKAVQEGKQLPENAIKLIDIKRPKPN